MNISFINVDSNENDASGGAISTTSRARNAGDLIVVCTQIQTNTGATTAQISDQEGLTYTAIAGATVSSGNNKLQMFWAISAGHAGSTVTMTPDANCGFRGVSAVQIRDSDGAFSGNPLDDSDNGTGTSTNIACTNSVAVSVAQDAIVAFMLYTSASVSAGTGYTLSTTNLGSFWAVERKTAAASETPFATGSSSASFVITAASFKGVTAAGGTPNPPRGLKVSQSPFVPQHYAA